MSRQERYLVLVQGESRISAGYEQQFRSQNSPIGIETGWGSVSDSVRDFYLLHSVQAGFGAHPASYPIGTEDSFPGV
jgi:hypothetical protein